MAASVPAALSHIILKNLFEILLVNSYSYLFIYLWLVLRGLTDRVLGLVLGGVADRVRVVSFTWVDG